MYPAWTLRLLAAGSLLALLFVAPVARALGPRNTIYSYYNEAGELVRLDVRGMNLTYRGKSVRLTDCSDSAQICLGSDDLHIEVPRSCASAGSAEKYILAKGRTRFLSLEGLSGNIFRMDTLNERFGYGYNPSVGIVQLIIIPHDRPFTLAAQDERIAPYIYRIRGSRAPYACK